MAINFGIPSSLDITGPLTINSGQLITATGNRFEVNGTNITMMTSDSGNLSSVSVTGSNFITRPNFIGIGGVSVYQVGSSVFISGNISGGGGGGTVTQAQLDSVSGWAGTTIFATGSTLYNLILGLSGATFPLNNIVFTTGNQNIGNIKTFYSGIFTGRVGIGVTSPKLLLEVLQTQNSEVAQFGSLNSLSDILVGTTGGTGYWGFYKASLEAYPLILDDRSGFLNAAFKFVKDYRTLGLLESNSNYLKISTTTGTPASIDFFAQDLLMGVKTGSTGAYIQSVWQNVAYTPLALQPNGGFVGIGSFFAKNPLHVITTNSEPVLIENTDSSSYSQILFGTTPNHRYQIGAGGTATPTVADKFYLYDAPAGQFRSVYDGAGRFGLGTTSPTVHFHVTGDIRFQKWPNGILATDSNGNIFTTGVSITGNSNIPNIVYTTGNQNIGNIKTFYSGIFTGRVGIGTSSPVVPLHVVGTDGASSVGLGTILGNKDWFVIENSGNSNMALVAANNSAATLRFSKYGDSTSLRGAISYFHDVNGGFLSLYQNGRRAIVITGNGFVGMGTDNPTANLQVTGGVRFEALSNGILATDTLGNLFVTGITITGTVSNVIAVNSYTGILATNTGIYSVYTVPAGMNYYLNEVVVGVVTGQNIHVDSGAMFSIVSTDFVQTGIDKLRLAVFTSGAFGKKMMKAEPDINCDVFTAGKTVAIHIVSGALGSGASQLFTLNFYLNGYAATT